MACLNKYTILKDFSTTFKSLREVETIFLSLATKIDIIDKDSVPVLTAQPPAQKRLYEVRPWKVGSRKVVWRNRLRSNR